MDVDEGEAQDRSALCAAGLVVMELGKFNIESDLSVLVCTTCQAGIHKSSAIVHGQTHGVRLTKLQIADLNKLVPTLRLANSTKDFPSPPNDEAPIEHLKVQDGIRCHACTYSCRTANTIEKHWSDNHRDFGRVDHSKCKVQSIFAASPIFFVVRPILSRLAPDDKYRLYLTQFEAEIAEADKHIVPPISENEVPPLLRVTLWHEHLAPYTTDKVSVRKLRYLLDTHRANNKTPALGKPLYNTITAYMQDIKRKMRNTPIPARMLLMQYPV
jgi:hypothetical protein